MSKPDSSNSYKTRLKGGGANKLKFCVKKKHQRGYFLVSSQKLRFWFNHTKFMIPSHSVYTYKDRKLKYFIMKAMYLSSKIKVITPDTVCYIYHTFSYIRAKLYQ